jgi:hypothetical protein
MANVNNTIHTTTAVHVNLSQEVTPLIMTFKLEITFKKVSPLSYEEAAN